MSEYRLNGMITVYQIIEHGAYDYLNVSEKFIKVFSLPLKMFVIPYVPQNVEWSQVPLVRPFFPSTLFCPLFIGI